MDAAFPAARRKRVEDSSDNLRIPEAPVEQKKSLVIEGLGANTAWARIFKRLWSPGIDSKEWIPPAL